MKISLVIPTLNGGKLLEEVLVAVDAQEGMPPIEKIAIDSGSTDDTIANLKRHEFETAAIRQKNFNHGTTRDQAISMTSGDVIVLLTQDAIPADTQWLKTLIDVYQDPAVAAAYCRQLPRADCNPFIAARLREWNAGRTERVIQRLEEGRRLEEFEPMERLRLCAFDNVASSLRRDVWQEYHFGSRRFGEDVAFGKALIAAGQSIVFEPSSMVIHSHNRSAQAEGKRIYCDHANLRALFGIHLIPNYKAWRQSLEAERNRHAETVAKLEIPATEKVTLQSWARSYAYWSTFGMYLGANSHSKMHGHFGFFHRILDRWMRRGI